MEELCRITGLSYGLLNILLFVILGPLSTLMFMFSTLAHVYIKSPTAKKITTAVFFSLGVLIILMIICPLFIAFLNTPI